MVKAFGFKLSHLNNNIQISIYGAIIHVGKRSTFKRLSRLKANTHTHTIQHGNKLQPHNKQYVLVLVV